MFSLFYPKPDHQMNGMLKKRTSVTIYIGCLTTPAKHFKIACKNSFALIMLPSTA